MRPTRLIFSKISRVSSSHSGSGTGAIRGCLSLILKTSPGFERSLAPAGCDHTDSMGSFGTTALQNRSHDRAATRKAAPARIIARLLRCSDYFVIERDHFAIRKTTLARTGLPGFELTRKMVCGKGSACVSIREPDSPANFSAFE
jgi:hypothetical protein